MLFFFGKNAHIQTIKTQTSLTTILVMREKRIRVSQVQLFIKNFEIMQTLQFKNKTKDWQNHLGKHKIKSQVDNHGMSDENNMR